MLERSFQIPAPARLLRGDFFNSIGSIATEAAKPPRPCTSASPRKRTVRLQRLICRCVPQLRTAIFRLNWGDSEVEAETSSPGPHIAMSGRIRRCRSGEGLGKQQAVVDQVVVLEAGLEVPIPQSGRNSRPSLAWKPVEKTPALLSEQGAVATAPQPATPRFQYEVGPTVTQVGASNESG